MEVILDVNATKQLGELAAIQFEEDQVLMVSPHGLYLDSEHGLDEDNERSHLRNQERDFWYGLHCKFPLCCIFWFIYAAPINYHRDARPNKLEWKLERSVCPDCLVKAMENINHG